MKQTYKLHKLGVPLQLIISKLTIVRLSKKECLWLQFEFQKNNIKTYRKTRMVWL